MRCEAEAGCAKTKERRAKAGIAVIAFRELRFFYSATLLERIIVLAMPDGGISRQNGMTITAKAHMDLTLPGRKPPQPSIWSAFRLAGLGITVIEGMRSAALMDKIEYDGTVWAINHNNPEPLVEHSIKKLQDYGIKKDDIMLTDAPENVKVGAIVVEIWPHHLDVARVRTIRNESFISGTVMTIELETDELGNYIN